MIARLRSDERGLGALQWIGIIAAIFVILSLIPQFRAALDVFYETLVGKNNLGPDGEPAPGVLVRGIIVAVASFVVFIGAIFVINYTNLGRKLAFLVTGASFFGFMALLGLLYSLYAPRGVRPVTLEGLNSFQLRILPGAMTLGSVILFVMFLVALNRYEEDLGED